MTNPLNDINIGRIPGFEIKYQPDFSALTAAQSTTGGATAGGAVDAVDTITLSTDIYTAENLEKFVQYRQTQTQNQTEKPDFSWYDEEFKEVLKEGDAEKLTAEIFKFKDANSGKAAKSSDVESLKKELIQKALTSKNELAEFKKFIENQGNPLDSASLSNAALAAMLNGPAIDPSLFAGSAAGGSSNMGGYGGGMDGAAAGGSGSALEKVPELIKAGQELLGKIDPKDAVIVDVWGGSSSGAHDLDKIPTGYADAFGKVQTAPDAVWKAPALAKIDPAANSSDLNGYVGSVGANFENGNYKFGAGLTNEDKLAQVDRDLANTDEIIKQINLHSKNEQIGIGNNLVQDLHADGKAQTEKVCGKPPSESPEDVVGKNPTETIPKAYETEYLKVQEKFGLGEKDDEANKAKVTATYTSKTTTKDEVQSAIKETDKIGELTGQREYLGKVEAGAGKDKADAESEKGKLEKEKGGLSSSLNLLQNIKNPSEKVSGKIDEILGKIEKITKKVTELLAEIKRLGELLGLVKKERPKIEEKIKTNAQKRTEEITAIKSGTNDKVKNAIQEKQNGVTAIENEVTRIINAVSSESNINSVSHTAIQLTAVKLPSNNASLFSDKAAVLVNAANTNIQKSKSERETKKARLEAIKNELTKIRDNKPEADKKSLKELGTEEATKGQKPSPSKEETVEISNSPAKNWENLKIEEPAGAEKPGEGRGVTFNNPKLRAYVHQEIPQIGATFNIVDYDPDPTAT